jgi:ribonuclease Y
MIEDAKKSAENIIEKANVQAEAVTTSGERKILELKSQHDADIQSREKKCRRLKTYKRQRKA